MEGRVPHISLSPSGVLATEPISPSLNCVVPPPRHFPSAGGGRGERFPWLGRRPASQSEQRNRARHTHTRTLAEAQEAGSRALPAASALPPLRLTAPRRQPARATAAQSEPRWSARGSWSESARGAVEAPTAGSTTKRILAAPLVLLGGRLAKRQRPDEPDALMAAASMEAPSALSQSMDSVNTVTGEEEVSDWCLHPELYSLT
ncbi:uncharacterized protein LOC134527126 [Bacillus rossius redtenbacheri]|uniref:uncharacterized protein LOC134527126 n=1 Tax=Bacillus rossius redtenbacheri TaxID=93214 RepID=UPI002FDE3284